MERAEAVARFRLTQRYSTCGPPSLIKWPDHGLLLRTVGRTLIEEVQSLPKEDDRSPYEYPTDDIGSRYWEARNQMVKKPSTGVG
ncbi:hypothetical protein TNCV_2308841 [Trichonephila clavipes]|nr:hypothetical protein TNCV_2308841 [Trichonephila clavipes]